MSGGRKVKVRKSREGRTLASDEKKGERERERANKRRKSKQEEKEEKERVRELDDRGCAELAWKNETDRALLPGEN